MRRRTGVWMVGMFMGVAVGGLVACGGGGDDDGGGGDSKVEVIDVLFRPDAITIGVGKTVTWEWRGRLPHQVVGTFNGVEVKSERMSGTGTFSYTFDTAGVFEYICGVHVTGMAGKVTIE